MPTPRPSSGLSVRQERFCHAYLRTGIAASAAVEAGYAAMSCVNQGYRLMKSPAVQARIAEIQAEQARAACAGTDVLLGKLETVYRRALGDQLYHAAARAVDLQARILRHALWDRRALEALEAVEGADVASVTPSGSEVGASESAENRCLQQSTQELRRVRHSRFGLRAPSAPRL